MTIENTKHILEISFLLVILRHLATKLVGFTFHIPTKRREHTTWLQEHILSARGQSNSIGTHVCWWNDHCHWKYLKWLPDFDTSPIDGLCVGPSFPMIFPVLSINYDQYRNRCVPPTPKTLYVQREEKYPGTRLRSGACTLTTTLWHNFNNKGLLWRLPLRVQSLRLSLAPFPKVEASWRVSLGPESSNQRGPKQEMATPIAVTIAGKNTHQLFPTVLMVSWFCYWFPKLLPADRIPFHHKRPGLNGLKPPQRQNSRWLATFRDWPVSVPVSNPKPHQKYPKIPCHTEAANGSY